MSGVVGNNIVRSGLVLHFDSNKKKSSASNTMLDLAGVHNLTLSGYGVSNSSGLTWANNVAGITISLLLEKTATTTEYAYHPISKWDGSSLNKASFVLYHFGNYLGNGQDGVLGWYAGAGGAWQQIAPYGFGTMVTGNKWHIVLQYNSSSGGQAWVNGSKAGTRYASGLLGSGGSSNDIGIYGPDNYVTSKVHQVMFYNRELSDAEILQNYNAYYKSKIIT